MSIEYSATVYCDDCNEASDVTLNEYAGDPHSVGVEDETLESMGWAVIDGEHFCSDCKGDHEDE